MKLFIDRFSNLVKGTISGFDRLVFKGLVLPLMSTNQVMTFCRYKGILNKDYKKWIMKQTKILNGYEPSFDSSPISLRIMDVMGIWLVSYFITCLYTNCILIEPAHLVNFNGIQQNK